MKNQGLQFLQKQSVLLELSKMAYDDTREIYNRITETTANILDIDRVSIWHYDLSRSQITCRDLYIKSEKRHESGSILSLSEYPRYYTALKESRFISIQDVATDLRANEFFEEYHKPLGIISMLDIPVRTEGMITAVFCCEQTSHAREWTQEEEDFVSSVADIVSLVIQTANRREVENELRKSEEKYRQIVDNAVFGIYRSNISGQFLFLNLAMARICDFDSIKQGMLTNIEKLYKRPEDRKALLTKLIQEQVVNDYEIELKTIKGKTRHVLLNAFFEGDNILGMMVDITERKKSEVELKNARDKAEESDRLKTSLLANMSHEFRTPMNAILGFSDLISTESQEPDIVLFARKIYSSGQRLMTTLKSILDLADLEATKSKVRFIPVNIQRILAKILQPFYPVANEKGLFLLTEFKEDLIAFADENLLHMILHNLIDNAIKFTQTGGVTIETELCDSEEGRNIVIRVKDTGIGIRKEHLDAIFHEFRQVSEGYARSHEGTGLGLSLAYRMTEMVNGRISVESEFGLGSIFSLYIPCLEEKTKTKESDNRDLLTDLPPKAFRMYKPDDLPIVLIVEDNNDNAEILKLYLKGRFRTERAPDANAAIRMAGERQFSCILMDINLGPGMDGLKAAMEIKKMEQYRQVPIVAITGYTMAGDREKLLEGGCDFYLGKPFSQQGLHDLMMKVFANNLS
ncbi:MAG: ATP-binding protein [bacterium]